MNKIFRIRYFVLGFVVVLVVIAGFSVAVMLLWNALVPDIFGLPALAYWQAVGILVLTRILFGGIGKNQLSHLEMGRGFHHSNSLREKWMNMTEEERKAFVEKEKGFHHFFHDRFSTLNDLYKGKETKTDKQDTSE
jgi:ABC-type multidrug transport system fused ATPase/permease subunit